MPFINVCTELYNEIEKIRIERANEISKVLNIPLKSIMSSFYDWRQYPTLTWHSCSEEYHKQNKKVTP